MELGMPPSVDLSSQTFTRLQGHAVPLIDNIETVINRLLDFYDARNGAATAQPTSASSGTREFNPTMPPDLKHTKVLSIVLCGKELGRPESNWNALLIAAIREAMARLKKIDAVKRIVIVNSTVGKKEDEGYRYLPDVGLSVQGQDANAAWKAALHIAKQLACEVDVEFAWRSKEDAAFPGVTGRFRFAGR
jgi:hypothetical protein